MRFIIKLLFIITLIFLISCKSSQKIETDLPVLVLTNNDGDSLYNVLKNIDYDLYKKKQIKFVLDLLQLSEYKEPRFISDNKCLLRVVFRVKPNIQVEIYPNSF